MNPAIREGSIINGKYKIIRQLGEGGFACVFLADDPFFSRRVALKLLKTGFNQAEQDLQRYQREAKLLGQLQHPNIITVFSFELMDDSIPFIVMEYLEGRPLSMLLAEKGKLSPDLSVNIIRQVLSGLSFAHSADIIHRDLSPANIFLLGTYPDYKVKLIDFGLSKLISDMTDKLTRTGQLLGNPPYMAPEQITGSQLDQRTDIYAVGCILYEILTGKQAFFADSPLSVIYMKQHGMPTEPAIDSGDKRQSELLKAIILKSIQLEPAARFESCAQMGEAFSADIEQILGKEISQVWNFSSSKKALPTGGYLIILLVLLSVIASSFYFVSQRQKHAEQKFDSDFVKSTHSKANKGNLDFFEKQLAEREKRYGNTSPLIIKNLEELAEAYETAPIAQDANAVRTLHERWNKSCQLRKKAISIRGLHFGMLDEKSFPPDGLPTTVHRRFDLANALLKAGRLDEAEPELKTLLSYELGKDAKGNLQAKAILQDLGDLQVRKKEYALAEKYYRQAIDVILGSQAKQRIGQYLLGGMGRRLQEGVSESQASFALAQLNLRLGESCLYQGKYSAAGKLFDETLALCDLSEKENQGPASAPWINVDLQLLRSQIQEHKQTMAEDGHSKN